MKRQLTTGTHAIFTSLLGGAICHVAEAAEFLLPMIAKGKRLITYRFVTGRDDSIGVHRRRWRSGQYGPQPVPRLR